MADTQFRSTQISPEGGVDTYYPVSAVDGGGGGFLVPLEGPLGLPLGRKGGALEDRHRH